MPQHRRAAPLLYHYPGETSGDCRCEPMPFLALADVSTLSSLRPLAHLLPSRLPAEYHPLKYLQSVTSVLRHSQAEQLLSGPESRLDQISRCFPQTGNCGICSPICPPTHTRWNANQQPSNVAHMSVELPRCGQTPTLFCRSQRAD